jgi:hypothetical protein
MKIVRTKRRLERRFVPMRQREIVALIYIQRLGTDIKVKKVTGSRL